MPGNFGGGIAGEDNLLFDLVLFDFDDPIKGKAITGGDELLL